MRSLRTLFILSTLVGTLLPCTAQLGDRIRYLLNGDTLPDYDTTYVITYRSALVISALTKYQFVTVDLEPAEGDALSLSSNNNEQYGVGLNYKWLSAEITFDVPAFNQYDPSLGKTTSRGIGIGTTGRRLWARAFWNNTTGYYLDDPQRWLGGWRQGDPTLVRPDLSNDTYLLSAKYALSGKRRYSHNAALFQMERQKKSAGTFLAGITAWRNVVSADSSLIGLALQDTFQLATGFTEVERTLGGLLFGYTHTFAFWHKGFLQVSVVPGVCYIRQSIAPTVGEELVGAGIAGTTEFELGAGYNGDRWYAALTNNFYYATADIAENLGLSTNYGFTRFAVGIRLGGPKIKGLEKLGL